MASEAARALARVFLLKAVPLMLLAAGVIFFLKYLVDRYAPHRVPEPAWGIAMMIAMIVIRNKVAGPALAAVRAEYRRDAGPAAIEARNRKVMVSLLLIAVVLIIVSLQLAGARHH